MVDKSNWKRCSLCGNPVHPLQESSAQPLADGVACVSCAFGKVNPTIRNNGIPSHFAQTRNDRGSYVSYIVPDSPIYNRKKEEKKIMRVDCGEVSCN